LTELVVSLLVVVVVVVVVVIEVRGRETHGPEGRVN